MPHKGLTDTSETKKQMTDLKDHHFILGKDDRTFEYRSSTQVGMYANKDSPAREKPEWANRNTHYKLGTDAVNQSSDYSMRYQKNNTVPTDVGRNESIQNKAKIEADTVVIGSAGAKLDDETTSGKQFKYNYASAVSLRDNAALAPFAAHNIRSSHF